jgi:putative flippase GtrA
MGKNNADLLIQFVKYCIAGGIATLTHIIIFYLIAWKIFPALQDSDVAVVFLGMQVTPVDVATRSLNSMLSNGGAFIFSNMVAYIANICFVFESGRHNKFVEISLFYLVSGISIVIGTGIMGFLIRYFGMQTTIAFTANIVTAVMINYSIRKFYIFKG